MHFVVFQRTNTHSPDLIVAFFHCFCMEQSTTPASRRRRASVEKLPKETIKHIFHYLDANSLCSSEQVCSFWRDASKDDTYWVDLCRAHFGLCPSSLKPPPDPVKVLYMLTSSTFAGIKYGSAQRGIRVF